MLHFQWFADMGNAEAQRTLGQMLNQGGQQRDPQQALRYFRCAHDPLHALVSAPHMSLAAFCENVDSSCYAWGLLVVVLCSMRWTALIRAHSKVLCVREMNS